MCTISFQAGIFNTLMNDVQLMDLLTVQVLPNTNTPTTPIFFGRIPPGVQLPMICFFTTGGPQPDWTFEADYYEQIDFQVSIFSEVPDTTTRLANRVDALLTWRPVPFDDVRNMALFRTSPIDNLLLEPAVDESDQDVWMIPLLYSAWLLRALASD